ncbi:MAG TPA: phosphotransferase [Thermoanaerobaculia bacterium]|nr:phosphotransferase [Thermoanaerobaculia bacterium]HUM29534.1 phosphotransferase [Thermoanaerobaculia bacterium]HXK67917.1 phosphotransferase [Thermoanaerobaculia bacterium]
MEPAPADILTLPQWEELQTRLGESILQMETIAPDVSIRRFFRIYLSSITRVLMVYPSDTERAILDRDFTMMTSFALAGLSPSVLFRGPSWFLMEDGGTMDLAAYMAESGEKGHSLLIRSAGLIPSIQALPGEISTINPPFDSTLFQQELTMTLRWYIRQFLGNTASSEVETFFTDLAETVARFPRRFLHRDFHANNILVSPAQTALVVDVQDARLGPRGYDLVSLLHERAALSFPEKSRWDWIREITEQCNLGTWDSALEEEFHLTLLQRNLKALGTFARQVISGRMAYKNFLEGSQTVLKSLLNRLHLSAFRSRLLP